MPYKPYQTDQRGQMLSAGVGDGLNRTLRIAGDQMRNPESDLMTSILRGYGVRTDPKPDLNAGGPDLGESTDAKGLLATLKSL
jgi:hypothetical protein